MLKKLITATAATALMASAATASVRPMAAVPTAATATSAVQVHDDDGHNEIYWIIGIGAVIGVVLFVLAFDGDDDDDELPVSLG